MKTHKFARKPFYVDAVRVSEANMEEVADWCNGVLEGDTEKGTYIKVQVHRPLNDRQTEAYVGDWVLDAGNGFKVYTPKAFDKSFEKVKTLTKAQADEAGIRVPHEPRPKNEQKKMVPADPRLPFEVPKTETEAEEARAAMGVEKKDEVDELFNEVLNEG